MSKTRRKLCVIQRHHAIKRYISAVSVGLSRLLMIIGVCTGYVFDIITQALNIHVQPQTCTQGKHTEHFSSGLGFPIAPL